MKIDYWYNALISADSNYFITEKECISVVWALKALRSYISGTQDTVSTDQDALKWMSKHVASPLPDHQVQSEPQ